LVAAKLNFSKTPDTFLARRWLAVKFDKVNPAEQSQILNSALLVSLFGGLF